MRSIKRNISALTLGLLSITVQISAYAEGFILTAPPRETPEVGLKKYGPIADYLTKALGVPVKYEHPRNWLKYQREMRNDKYDIIFDGPHFISWRIAHLGHEAIVKLPGELQFVLVTKKNNEAIKTPDELVGKKICGISPPNLSTLSILANFLNPVRQPTIKGIKGGMGKVNKLYAEKKCDAAVFRTVYFHKKLTQVQRDNFKILYKSKVMPNQGISVSKRLSRDVKDKLQKDLTSGNGVASTTNLLKAYAGKAKNMIPVKPKEYEGYNMLLEGVIFGW